MVQSNQNYAVALWTLSLLYYYLIPLQRNKEINRLRVSVEKFLCNGYIVLPSSVSSQEKQRIWTQHIAPCLQQLWPTIDLSDARTWPLVASGAAKQYTIKDFIPGLPKLVSDNYEVQAVIVTLYDPHCRRFHFGQQTHWRLKLLIRPSWLLRSMLHCAFNYFSSNRSFAAPPIDTFALVGEDQAWHLPLFPQLSYNGANGSSSQCRPIPRGSHIDSGPMGLLSQIPLHRHHSVLHLLFCIVFLQSAIVFYCDTPGVLTAARGSTGFYPSSHVVLMESLLRVIGEKEAIASELQLAHVLELIRDWSPAVAEQAQDCNKQVIQLELPADRCILGFGTIVHSTMFATEPMRASRSQILPRLIQNCKIHADLSQSSRSSQNLGVSQLPFLGDNAKHRLQLIEALPFDSPLLQFCLQPLEKWKQLAALHKKDCHYNLRCELDANITSLEKKILELL